MTSLFLDANLVIALQISDDQLHDDAVHYWQTLIENRVSLVTTSYVVDEIVTFLNNRRQHDKAVKIGNDLLTASRIQVVHVGEPLFYEAWDYFAQHADKTYSLTDCISIVLMARFAITQALTFDRYFVQAGLETLPRKTLL